MSDALAIPSARPDRDPPTCYDCGSALDIAHISAHDQKKRCAACHNGHLIERDNARSKTYNDGYDPGTDPLAERRRVLIADLSAASEENHVIVELLNRERHTLTRAFFQVMKCWIYLGDDPPVIDLDGYDPQTGTECTIRIRAHNFLDRESLIRVFDGETMRESEQYEREIWRQAAKRASRPDHARSKERPQT